MNNFLYELNLQLFAEDTPPNNEDNPPADDIPPADDKPQVTVEDLDALREEVKALKDENTQLKTTVETQHTKIEELSSSVGGAKDDLAKIKEAYAEQFESGSKKESNIKVNERSLKPRNELVAEMIDLISK